MSNHKVAKKGSLKDHQLYTTAVLFIALAIVPLIVGLKIKPVNAEALGFWNRSVNTDFFSYYKSLAIILLAIFMGVLLTIKKPPIRRNTQVAMLVILAMCIVLSTLFSIHPYTAIFGFPDRYEGIGVLLSYLVLFIGASQLVENKNQLKVLIWGLLASACIIAIIGLFQFLGYDFLQQNGGFKTGNFVSATLYNPNTFGLYMSMLFPFTLFLALFSKQKSTKIVLSLMACLTFVSLLTSLSRGSCIGAFASILITGGLLGNRLVFKWKHLLVMIFMGILLYLAVNSYSLGILSDRMSTVSSVKQVHLEDQKIDKIKDFKISNNTLNLICSNSTLTVKLEGTQLLFYDEQGQKLTLSKKDTSGAYELINDHFKFYKITSAQNLFKIQKGKSFLYFAIKDGKFMFLSSKGEVWNETDVRKYGFEGYERVGSGRGYIWSRSLPILSQTLLIGTGPDTFGLEFPQKDFKGKLNFMYDAYILIDKPHNMYLQTAINTGIISLMAMLVLFGRYLWVTGGSILHKQSDEYEFEHKLQVSIFAAIVAYLLSALFTDSAVSVAPIFWILLGLGSSKIFFAINHPFSHQMPNSFGIIKDLCMISLIETIIQSEVIWNIKFLCVMMILHKLQI